MIVSPHEATIGRGFEDGFSFLVACCTVHLLTFAHLTQPVPRTVIADKASDQELVLCSNREKSTGHRFQQYHTFRKLLLISNSFRIWGSPELISESF